MSPLETGVATGGAHTLRDPVPGLFDAHHLEEAGSLEDRLDAMECTRQIQADVTPVELSRQMGEDICTGRIELSGCLEIEDDRTGVGPPFDFRTQMILDGRCIRPEQRSIEPNDDHSVDRSTIGMASHPVITSAARPSNTVGTRVTGCLLAPPTPHTTPVMGCSREQSSTNQMCRDLRLGHGATAIGRRCRASSGNYGLG